MSVEGEKSGWQHKDSIDCVCIAIFILLYTIELYVKNVCAIYTEEKNLLKKSNWNLFNEILRKKCHKNIVEKSALQFPKYYILLHTICLFLFV